MKSVLVVPHVLCRKHCACSSDNAVTRLKMLTTDRNNREGASVCVTIALATGCEIMSIRHRHNQMSERQFY